MTKNSNFSNGYVDVDVDYVDDTLPTEKHFCFKGKF